MCDEPLVMPKDGHPDYPIACMELRRQAPRYPKADDACGTPPHCSFERSNEFSALATNDRHPGAERYTRLQREAGDCHYSTIVRHPPPCENLQTSSYPAARKHIPVPPLIRIYIRQLLT